MASEIFKLSDITGATRFLSLSVNAVSKYSADGITWHSIVATGLSDEGSGGVEYSFGYGLKQLDGSVTIDSSVVPVLKDGKLPPTVLPSNVPTTYANGLDIVSGELRVTKPNTPNNIVVLPADGILPADILPKQPESTQYTAGMGIDIQAGVISEKWEDFR